MNGLPALSPHESRRVGRVYGWIFLVFLTLAFIELPHCLDWLEAKLSCDIPARYVCAVAALAITVWRPRAFGLRLGDHRKVWWIYAAAVPAWIAYFLIAPGVEPDELRGYDWGAWTYLLVPFTEELLFRGFMYGLLADMYPASEATRKWFSKPVWFTAILFAVWHIDWIEDLGWAWGLGNVVFIFGIGLVFGYIRRRTGSVLGPFLLHAVGNFLNTL
jgi:membrane protease YdiL (CAAX protease family)